MNTISCFRCVHCKHLLPVFEEAAQELKNSRKGSPIPLAKVDAKAETNLAKKYDIKRYPTIKVFRRGKASSYKNGAQDKRGMYNVRMFCAVLRCERENFNSQVTHQITISTIITVSYTHLTLPTNREV